MGQTVEIKKRLLSRLFLIIISIGIITNNIASCSSHSDNISNEEQKDNDQVPTFQPESTGEKLFLQNCSSCHFTHKDMTGPALKGSRNRWKEYSSEENFYAFIRNAEGVILSGDKYAIELKKKYKSVMTPQALTNEEIDDIFEYVEAVYPPAEKIMD